MTKIYPKTTHNIKSKLILLPNITQQNIKEFNCDGTLDVIKQCNAWEKWKTPEEWKIIIAHLLRTVFNTTDSERATFYFEKIYKHLLLIGEASKCSCGFSWEHTSVYCEDIDHHYLCVARLDKNFTLAIESPDEVPVNFLFLFLLRMDKKSNLVEEKKDVQPIHEDTKLKYWQILSALLKDKSNDLRTLPNGELYDFLLKAF